MITANNFSIRTLLNRMNNPLVKRSEQCLYIMKVSQLVRDTTGSGNSYTDTHYECSKLKKRITKKHCRYCKLYQKPN